MEKEQLREAALKYHAEPRPGKIEVVSTKPLMTQNDLSLGYTPGVAEVCTEIKDNPAAASQYTSKSNLVAVITNGTAVLGLGNIGPLAAKPVMEGKAVLFKKFADIDVFDLEVAETDPEKFVETVVRLSPTFGGINLEDIKAPECFYIEEQLRERLDIPVLHDDQHGTAIIVLASFINSLKVTGKDKAKVKIACSGAGAAGMACMNLLVDYGVPIGNITLVDVNGVIHDGRDDLTEQHKPFARKTKMRILADALDGADYFFGVSAGGILKPAMVKKMADKPVIFAMANPTPEIMPDLAREARPDAIIGTGRSDFPNQINNVLGFPYLFRGALDCGAKTFNTEMKIAAAEALASLARREVDATVAQAYRGERLRFGPDYLIPKPFDPRLLSTIAPAVAKAAMDTGVARRPIADLKSYAHDLLGKVDQSFSIMRQIYLQAQPLEGERLKKIVYPEGEDPRILQTAQEVVNLGFAKPVLLGRPEVVEPLIRELGLGFSLGDEVELINPQDDERLPDYAEQYYDIRKRDGVSRAEARVHLRSRWLVWACLMVKRGEADAVVCGVSGRFMRFLNVAAHIVNGDKSTDHIYALNLVMSPSSGVNGGQLLALCDTHVQANPTAEQIAEMTAMASEELERFGVTPRVALLSHSNFGSSVTPQSRKMSEARELIARYLPTINVEGEMQADTALNMTVMQRIFPASALTEPANTLIFPDVDSGNIAFNLLRMTMPGAEYIGPILLGMQKPIHILSIEAPVRRVVNMSALAVVQAQALCQKKKLADGR